MGCVWKLRILGLDQAPVGEQGSCSTTAFRESVTLQADGFHTVVVDPGWYSTGTAAVSLYVVPPDGSGMLTINDTPAPVAFTRPGQNALLTFEGTQGQQVTVRVTNSNVCWTWVGLRRADNSILTSIWGVSANFNLVTQTLPSSGTYKVEMDPEAINTGALSVQVTSP